MSEEYIFTSVGVWEKMKYILWKEKKISKLTFLAKHNRFFALRAYVIPEFSHVKNATDPWRDEKKIQ